jgi:hypothetical protein
MSDPQFGYQSEGSLLVQVTCTFVNDGAQTGVIDMLALRFKSLDDDTVWIFEPKYVIDETRELSSDKTGMFKSGFTGIVLPGKQSVTHTYAFVTAGPTKVEQRKSLVTLYTATPERDGMTPQQERTLDFTPQVVWFLQHNPTLVTVPFEETKRHFQKLAAH